MVRTFSDSGNRLLQISIMRISGGFAISLLLILGIIFGANSAPHKRNKLMYIMLDGFRYDYVDDHHPNEIPGFSKLLRNGVKAKYMTPIFPSISYPDWTTLVTGLWVESHGLVGNYFYDADEKDIFSLFDADSTGKHKWWTAEPIWVTATKADLRTAVILWSRCDIPFDGITPEYCEPFVSIKGHEIFRKNVEKALQKLEEGFDFIMVYNEHTDNVGHAKGPESEERRQAVRDLDKTIAYLLQRIEELGMTDEVNIIIVSDHGMVDTAPGRVRRVELDDFLLTDLVESVAEAGAYSNIKVKEERFINQVYQKLKTMPGVEVYKHDEIPDELHYRKHKYIHDIVLKANIDTFIMNTNSSVGIPPRSNYVYFGAHGFDPREEKMRAIFFATGPAFKVGSETPPIQNVDVYPLLAHLLHVTPKLNNGTWSNIEPVLRDSTQEPDADSPNKGSIIPVHLTLIPVVACVAQIFHF